MFYLKELRYLNEYLTLDWIMNRRKTSIRDIMRSTDKLEYEPKIR